MHKNSEGFIHIPLLGSLPGYGTLIFFPIKKWPRFLEVKEWFFFPKTFLGNGFSQKDVVFIYILWWSDICIMVAYSPYTDVAPENRVQSLITFFHMLPPSSDLFRKWFWRIARRLHPLSWPESHWIIVTYSPYTAYIGNIHRVRWFFNFFSLRFLAQSLRLIK